MLKSISPLLIAGLLAMTLAVVPGCAGSDTVEIPTNFTKSPGRPASTDAGDGALEDSGMSAPPVDAPP